MTCSKTALIDTIKKLLERKASVDDFKPAAQELLRTVSKGKATVLENGTKLYRLTKHHSSLPTHVSELWFPPPENARMNRANRQGTSMFYCSVDPDCTLRELDVHAGDVAVLSEWSVQSRFAVGEIGYSARAFKDKSSTRIVPPHQLALYEAELNDEQKDLHDFLCACFTEPGEHYALTAAIAEVVLTDHPSCGIKYPSITKDNRSDNLALAPQSVTESLAFRQASLLKFISIEREGRICTHTLATTVTVSGGGELTWSSCVPTMSDRTVDVQIFPGMTIAFPASGLGKSEWQNLPGRSRISNPSGWRRRSDL